MTDKEWHKLLDAICAGTGCSDHKCPLYHMGTCLVDYFTENDEDTWGSSISEQHREELTKRIKDADIMFLERKAYLDTTYGDKGCDIIEPYIRSTILL